MKNKLKLPNLLLVGAAKSGTTSIYHYLKQHPDIFASPIKEPKFITAQFLDFPFMGIGDNRVEIKIVRNFDEYKNLFSKVTHEKIICEMSADYLYYYENSIKYIKYFLGDVRILIILRNPVDRAFSSYSHLVRASREHLSFEDALTKERYRVKMNWEFIWHYKNVGFYFKQVEAYLKNFSNVKVFLYDDLRNDTNSFIKKLYSFLEINHSFLPSNLNIRYNVSGIPINSITKYTLFRQSKLKDLVKSIMKNFLPYESLSNAIDILKSKSLKKQKMKHETRSLLINIFREDIYKLQDLIDRDLSHWL